ncbi:hypothetical protein BFP72_15085 [Reichenbachiella sp. 5M10]|nr:hypothetical protein BFP72_15085 [Reichenbachiella sp. 5M10]
MADEAKTVSLTLRNVPETELDERLIIFTFTNGVVYSAIEAIAEEDTTFMFAPPEGNKAYDVIAFIPGADWQDGDDTMTGKYSRFAGLTERMTDLVADAWHDATGVSPEDLTSDGALKAVKVTLSLPAGDNEYDAGDIVSIGATVTNNGEPGVTIASVTYFIDGVEEISYTQKPYTWNYNTKDLGPGKYSISVIATNSEGHSDEDIGEIVINDDLNDGPDVDITSPTALSSWTHGNFYNVNANITDSDLASVEYKINGSTVATYSKDDIDDGLHTTYRWNTADNSAGLNTIEVIATDEAGATRSDVINVNLDVPSNYTPKGEIANPVSNEEFDEGEVISFMINISDVENEIDSVVYTSNATRYKLTSAPYTYSGFNTAGLSMYQSVSAQIYYNEGNGSQVTSTGSTSFVVNPAP